MNLEAESGASGRLWLLQCHGCQGHIWPNMPLQSDADEPTTTGSGRVITGAKGAGIGHRANRDV